MSVKYTGFIVHKINENHSVPSLFYALPSTYFKVAHRFWNENILLVVMLIWTNDEYMKQ